MGRLC
ncbi:hypothetical protein LINPERHAP1_LOCUS26806 [Linum perenne]